MGLTLTKTGNVLKVEGLYNDPVYIENANYNVTRILDKFSLYDKVLGKDYELGAYTNIDSPVFANATDFETYLINFAVSVSGSSGATNTIDANNTTTTPLAGDAVFTGVWVDVSNYAEIKVSYDADVNGASCFLQFSPDAATVERSISVPPQSNTLQTNFGAIHTLNPILRYFRVVYTNGSVAQTSFSFSTILSVEYGGGLISRSTQVLNKYNDVDLVRNVSDAVHDRNYGYIGYQTAFRKFGVNEAVGNGAFEYINPSGAYTFPTSAEPLRIKAGGNAADDAVGLGARTVEVFFLDANFNEVTETLTTAGASASASTSASAIRLIRAKVKNCGTYGESNTGAIIIEQETSAIELGEIKAGAGITEQAIYTVPAGKTMYLESIFVSVGESNSADVRLVHVPDASVVAAPFTAHLHEWTISDFKGAELFNIPTFLKFEEKADVYVEAIRITGSGSARVSVDLDFSLVDNS